MLHKIRDVMGLRDNEYSLEGAVELDEGFFSTGSSKEDTDEPLKRGRGSQRKTKVLVMASTDTGNGVSETRKSVKPTALKYVKMVVISDLKSKTIDGQVVKAIDNESISNAKREFLDIHHNTSSNYLQYYLNEFCYKLNRRYFGDKLFDRILLAGISYKNSIRYNIG